MGALKDQHYGDLFYPERPGFKEPTTSKAAADHMAPSAGALRNAVLSALRRHGPMTADECAARVGRSVLAIRPRVTELKQMGKIAKTLNVRKNESGRPATVWRLA